ncbi:MAG: hypothetical protein CL803_03580 [Citromicrobium sp.]|nr:hypothetical protein [Citromicrobium sp.]MAO95452.1 hypothetical protein [Citromicrobium sp.]MAS85327.1 hypothetical protein [Erythrobacteraceae bacterium]MBT47778.1 hypothetical protein [Citromicrobium sp.]|tara:strand:+ start:375 stop:686 length:312 start_codon:yes stop_codon:yes gene_type:complete
MEGILALLIPIFALMIPMVAIWTKHQQKLAEMGLETTATASAEKAAQYATQIQRLEDRVQVLERIVTDKGYDVATQIEALRDTRSVEDNLTGTPLSFESRERA